MNDHPLISVIVPIYNVEKYLNRCIESIVNQTYRNLEIILVDDGSSDNCPRMCDEWARKDERIKVIHKENGGLSDARNAGMRIATGFYISFVDSDDYIEAEMMLNLIHAIISNNCDIASCRINMVFDSKPPQPLTPEIQTRIFHNSVEAMEGLISGLYLVQTVVNKLYKRATIANVSFPIGKLHEDEYWSWKAIASAQSIVCINELLYNYYSREGSIMQGGSSFNPMLVLEAKAERQRYIELNMPDLKNIARVNLLYSCLFQAQRSKELLPKKKYRQYYNAIKGIAKQCCPDDEYVKSLSLKKKIRILSICHFFGCVCVVQNYLGIGKESNI